MPGLQGLSNKQRRALAKAIKATQAQDNRIAVAAGLNGGRPKHDGERYPNGRLKPPLPNAVVLARRHAMFGGAATVTQLKAAESPLSFMRAKGWLSTADTSTAEGQKRATAEITRRAEAAAAYAALYRAAGLDLPTLRTGDLGEADLTRNTGQVTFDTIARRDPDGDPAAMERLRACWNAMTGPERQTLLEVCLMLAWPQWLADRINGAGDTVALNRFNRALDTVAAVLALPMSALRRQAA